MSSAEWARSSLVKPLREVLGDIEQIEPEGSDLLSPPDAGARAGYHPESICRLIRLGKLTNYGTKHRPRVKLSELPRKAPARRVMTTKSRSTVAGSIGESASSAAAIARDAIAGRIGR
jgi:hypothetical protein